MEFVIGIAVLALLLIALGAFLFMSYHGLLGLRTRVDGAWTDISRQLERRAELLPELIEVVRSYAAHERGVFDSLESARTASVHAVGPTDAALAENRLQPALRGLFSVAEAYPQLQSSQEFLHLQGELVETEDRVQASRRVYNGSVRELNAKVKRFPNTMFARRLDATPRDYFEVSSASAVAEPPRIQF